MASRSLVEEYAQIDLAIDLIKLGARLQFLESEIKLSRDRLIALYKEIKGVSPPKGLLPFSTDWFMTWLANVHSSMFYNIYRFIEKNGDGSPIVTLIDSYRLYLEQVRLQGGEAHLDFTRAWTLLRFVRSNLLDLARCVQCDGQFIAHTHDLHHDFVCVLCNPPSRARKVFANARGDDACDKSQQARAGASPHDVCRVPGKKKSVSGGRLLSRSA